MDHFRYAPYAEVGSEANVVVDGSPTPATVLTLSHWPGSPDVPSELQADLSAEMAFRYLDHPVPLHGEARLVSNNHFDQDGLVGLVALVHPEEALARRDLLEDVAAAGDFATYRFREAARASMVLAAFADPVRSPLAPLPPDYGEVASTLYSELIPRLMDMLHDLDSCRDLWAEEDQQLSESETAMADGTVRIVEHPDIDTDLAVVTATGTTRWSGHRFGHGRYDGVHPMAIHNATNRTALLLVTDDSYRFTYRYETWVQYRSRRLRPRVDLAPLAERLTAMDESPWVADPVDQLTPELQPTGPSSLSPTPVADAIADHLRTAPPAFDPYTPRGDPEPE